MGVGSDVGLLVGREVGMFVGSAVIGVGCDSNHSQILLFGARVQSNNMQTIVDLHRGADLVSMLQ